MPRRRLHHTPRSLKMTPTFKPRKSFSSFFFLLGVFFMSAVLLALTGCFGTTQEVLKEKIVYKPIVIPKNLLKPCTFSAPPYSPNNYAVFTSKEKEKVLTDYANRLLAEGRTCSDGFGEISNYQDRQINIIKEASP